MAGILYIYIYMSILVRKAFERSTEMQNSTGEKSMPKLMVLFFSFYFAFKTIRRKQRICTVSIEQLFQIEILIKVSIL